jgi:hypothetical protein
MDFEPGKGALFKNLKKSQPSHADYRGEANLGGKPYWVVGWIRTAAKTGDKYMALSFAAKGDDAGDARRATSDARRDMDDENPF